MRIKELLGKYVFHIFALIVFLLVSLYKFYPDIFTFKKETVITVEDSAVIKPDTPVYVDLSGAVMFPGVYEMQSTSRVGDLISKGGGFSQNASVLWISRNINLAKLLYDTQKIYVPYEWETYGDCNCVIDTLYLDVPLSNSSNYVPPDTSNSNDTGDSNQNVSDKINVNTASAEELDELSGIGPAYAQKIIDNRPYTDLDSLISKSGISENTLNKISSEITF